MKKALFLMSLVLLLGACSPFSLVNSETYNDADLASYKTFRIVSPADGDLPPGMEMVTFYNITAAIREHLIACNKAIMSGNREHMEEYVDLNSFIDMFILQELTKNPDAGCSSFFMQRDAGGKLYLTAPWDFDFAMGAYSVSRFTSGMVADGQGVASHPWFEFLAKQPWFMSMVLKRMEEIEGYVNLTLANVKGVMPFLEEAADMNHARWNLYGVKFSEYPSNQVTIQRKDYADHVDFLVSWVEERWKKMKIEVKALT